jgi:basic membrane protein A and related proteins
MRKITFRVISTITILSMIMITVVATTMSEPVFAKGIKPPKPTIPVTATLVTDAQGLGDFAFNDAAVVGLTLAEKKLKTQMTVIESNDYEAYRTNIEQAIEATTDLVITSGFSMAEETAKVATLFSTQKFAIIDCLVEEPNVASLIFKEQEGAFLVGVIAGLTTETNKIGIVTGGTWPVIDKYVYGFRAGIQSVNADADVLISCIDTFTEPQAGYDAANSQFDLGVDVIYHVAGLSGIGVINAASDRGLWAIGCDFDQSNVNPDAVLCSMVKRVDTAVYLTIKSIVDGTFKTGPVEFGLKEYGVGYSDKAGNVSDETTAIVKRYEKAIRNGSVIVPYDEETYSEFLI